MTDRECVEPLQWATPRLLEVLTRLLERLATGLERAAGPLPIFRRLDTG